ncbi:nuclear transport factor 2 family protein [Campylobacter lari]|nr:nuclear transport factor 2 family protein [Campylobacter lari]
MIKKLTEKYIKAFNDKDLEVIKILLSDDFILEDPIVKKVKGKQKCLEVIIGIFKNYNKLNFSAKNIYIDGNISCIEFILKLDDIVLQGVDILEFNGKKIKELRAYLDIPKG